MAVSSVRATSSQSAAAKAGLPTLRLGSRGAAVKTLQSRLRAKGYKVAVDGHFGLKTRAAVKAFQRRSHLSADGVVGPRTWAKLRASSGGSSGLIRATGYVNGRARKITLKSIGGGKYLRSDAATRFIRMRAAAARAGIRLGVNSAFRTMAQQTRLYRLYRLGQGNLAARPGYSNHQGGVALDIAVGSTSSRTYRWLRAHAGAYGFHRTVPSEPWHWGFR